MLFKNVFWPSVQPPSGLNNMESSARDLAGLEPFGVESHIFDSGLRIH